FVQILKGDHLQSFDDRGFGCVVLWHQQPDLELGFGAQRYWQDAFDRANGASQGQVAHPDEVPATGRRVIVGCLMRDSCDRFGPGNDGGSEFARIREVVSGTEWPDTSILTGRIHEHGAMLSCALEEWNGCVVEVHKSPTAAGTRGPQEVAERPSQAPNGKRQATASPYSRNEHARSRASSMGVGA